VTAKIDLNELKRIVESHTKTAIDIMEMIFRLDEKDLEDFTIWYNNHPYCRGVDEIRNVVRGGSNKSNKKSFSIYR
jgi:hypothetical protein